MDIARFIVDARSMQDPDYSFRGVGQHGSSLVYGLKYRDWHGRRPTLTALTASELPSLPASYASLFDDIKTTAALSVNSNDVFICLSPMTHDPIWLEPILRAGSGIKVAIVYDCIPLMYPERYLSSFKTRSEYLSCFAFLEKYDCFSSISQASQLDLARYFDLASKVAFVSGVAIRDAMRPRQRADGAALGSRSYWLVSGGGDPRKNPECALAAHASLTKKGNKQARDTSIWISGSYPESMKKPLREYYIAQGGRVEKLHFVNHVDDKTLQAVYAGAIATIVPSIAEGFSIPIIESIALGTPAVVSDIPAHRELVDDPDLRFDPHSPASLEAILDGLSEPDNWAKAFTRQKDVWLPFTSEQVVDRFVAGVTKARASQAITRQSARPGRRGLAMLSPLPPSKSGVADYSAATMAAIGRMTPLDVFTSTPNTSASPAYAALRATREFKRYKHEYQSTIFVLGNSHFHRQEFDLLMECGGSVLLHDSRMIDYYVHLCGIERTTAVAKKEMGGDVSQDQVYEWMVSQQNLPILFLSEIIAAADKIFTHSKVTADLMSKQYNCDPIVLPFAQYKQPSDFDASKERRDELRKKYQLQETDIVLGTFGYVHNDKAPDEIIWAVRLLHDWKVPVKLVFVGANGSEEITERLAELIEKCQLKDHIILLDEIVEEKQYIAWLLAIDIGVQLRTYFMGSLSGALNDCIAAALPCVANEHLATAMDAPSSVRRVPDYLSPLLLAEATLDIIDSGQHRARPFEISRHYAETHSTKAYADRLLQHIGN